MNGDMGSKDGQHETPAVPGGATFAGYYVGQVINAASARLEQKTTKPPARYTQATLVDDMVDAWKFGRNDVEREMLRESNGLGTSRTRIPMIEGLIQRGLLETVKSGKSWQIKLSPKGKHVLTLIPEDMRNVAMTARWELAFSGIRAGKFPAQAVLSNGYKFVDQLIAALRDRKSSAIAPGGGASASNASPQGVAAR